MCSSGDKWQRCQLPNQSTRLTLSSSTQTWRIKINVPLCILPRGEEIWCLWGRYQQSEHSVDAIFIYANMAHQNQRSSLHITTGEEIWCLWGRYQQSTQNGGNTTPISIDTWHAYPPNLSTRTHYELVVLTLWPSLVFLTPKFKKWDGGASHSRNTLESNWHAIWKEWLQKWSLTLNLSMYMAMLITTSQAHVSCRNTIGNRSHFSTYGCCSNNAHKAPQRHPIY